MTIEQLYAQIRELQLKETDLKRHEPNCIFCGKRLRQMPSFLIDELPQYFKCDCEEYKKAYKQNKEICLKVGELKTQAAHLEDCNLARKKHGEKIIEDCHLGKMFINRTFETYKGKDSKLYKTIKKYTDEFNVNQEQGILLYGGVGTGKTHLAAAVANELLKKQFTVRFSNYAELLADIQCTFGVADSGKSKEKLSRELATVDMLIIDDIGKEKPSQWNLAELYKIINKRYENLKPIIITTNLTPQKLEDRIGVDIGSRIDERCIAFHVVGADKRRC